MVSPVRIAALAAIIALAACADSNPTSFESPDRPAFALSADQTLGKMLYEDENLSLNRNQSCQTCHEPSQGFAAALPNTTTRNGSGRASQRCCRWRCLSGNSCSRHATRARGSIASRPRSARNRSPADSRCVLRSHSL